MARRGNRPDCAYFLLLGICLATLLITMGGIFSYVAFWPQLALHNAPHHHHPHLESSLPENRTSNLEANEKMELHNEEEFVPVTRQDKFRAGGTQNLLFSVLGPLLLLIGLTVLLTVIVYALRYDCDHEPEPNIAFLRLKSEMSLNLDAERNKYELMVPRDKSGLRGQTNDGNERY